MEIKVFSAGSGDIIYWTDYTAPEDMTLVFLPGLTADHRLFQRQLEAFAGRWRLLAWDPPAHGESRPFALNFSLRQQAEWLHAILEQEKIRRFCLIGQSMGGYVAQCFLQTYPGEAAGFISIDSAPSSASTPPGWNCGCCATASPSTGLCPGTRCGRWGPPAAPRPSTARA